MNFDTFEPVLALVMYLLLVISKIKLTMSIILPWVLRILTRSDIATNKLWMDKMRMKWSSGNCDDRHLFYAVCLLNATLKFCVIYIYLNKLRVRFKTLQDN